MAVLACIEILEIAPDAARLAQANADVLHVAIAAVEDVDYLLTWNCRPLSDSSCPRLHVPRSASADRCVSGVPPLSKNKRTTKSRHDLRGAVAVLYCHVIGPYRHEGFVIAGRLKCYRVRIGEL